MQHSFGYVLKYMLICGLSHNKMDTSHINADILHKNIKDIYNEYHDSLLAFAKSYVMREDIAQDLVQEAFIRLWEKDHDFFSEVALRSYLFASVKNLSLDYLKHLDVETCYAEAYMEKTSQEDVIDEQFDKEVMELLFKTIDCLPKRCREIFLLHLDGLSSTEIADKLSLSIDTVRTQKKRAMKFLREHFQSQSSPNISFTFIFFKLLCSI